MSGRATPDGVLISRHVPPDAGASDDELIRLYTEVYGTTNPFHSEEQYQRRLQGDPAGPRGYRNTPGFELVTARVSDELVGFLYGFPLPPDNEWWKGVTRDGQPVTGHADYALIDLVVAQGWQRRGVASALHDAWSGAQQQVSATLAVETDNHSAKIAYARWGYRHMGTVQDDPAAPVYDIMLRSAAPPAPSASRTLRLGARPLEQRTGTAQSSRRGSKASKIR